MLFRNMWLGEPHVPEKTKKYYAAAGELRRYREQTARLNAHRVTPVRLQTTAYGIRDTDYGIRDTAYGIRPTGYGIRDTGYGIRPTGYGIRDTDYGLQTTGENNASPGYQR
jgi:hypothetical protein